MPGQHRPLLGGCLCGAVRFESKEPPTRGYYCHCTKCQKAYGGLFSATVRVPGSGFRFTKGNPKYYRATTVAKRGFCAECGSPMPFFYEGNPDVWIKIGTLDHPEDWPMTKDASWGPSEHIHADDKISWEQIGDALPQSAGTSNDLLKAAEDHIARVAASADAKTG